MVDYFCSMLTTITIFILFIVEWLFKTRLEFEKGHCYLWYGTEVIRKYKLIW